MVLCGDMTWQIRGDITKESVNHFFFFFFLLLSLYSSEKLFNPNAHTTKQDDADVHEIA